jgi:hypothetical protein
MEERSLGIQKRQEDLIPKEKENSWDIFVDPKAIIWDDINDMKKQNIALRKQLEDLRKQLDKYTWDVKYKSL